MHSQNIEAPELSKRKGTPVFQDVVEPDKLVSFSTSSIEATPSKKTHTQFTNKAVKSSRMSEIGPTPLIHNIAD